MNTVELLGRALADHIIAMDDDAYLIGHPEWEALVAEARAVYTPIEPGYVMRPGHPLWRSFCTELGGPEFLDFKATGWKCPHTIARPYARRILAKHGADVEASLNFFSSQGGYCDCEILFNVDR